MSSTVSSMSRMIAGGSPAASPAAARSAGIRASQEGSARAASRRSPAARNTVSDSTRYSIERCTHNTALRLSSAGTPVAAVGVAGEPVDEAGTVPQPASASAAATRATEDRDRRMEMAACRKAGKSSRASGDAPEGVPRPQPSSSARIAAKPTSARSFFRAASATGSAPSRCSSAAGSSSRNRLGASRRRSPQRCASRAYESHSCSLARVMPTYSRRRSSSMRPSSTLASCGRVSSSTPTMKLRNSRPWPRAGSHPHLVAGSPCRGAQQRQRGRQLARPAPPRAPSNVGQLVEVPRDGTLLGLH